MLEYIIQKVEGKGMRASDIVIDVLMAMNWSKYSWETVTEDTIKNCFRRAYFTKEDTSDEETVSDEMFHDCKDFREIDSLIADIGENVTAIDFISADDHVLATNPVGDEEDESDVEIDIDDDQGNEEAAEADDISGLIEPYPTPKEAIAAMDILTRFYYSDNFMSQVEFDRFDRALRAKIVASKRQSLITDHFSTEQN